jgi:hypothetical protein
MYTEDARLARIITTFTTGVVSLNGLNTQTQFFTNGTSGLAPNWISLTDTHTLNIPLAATASVTAGLISKTEYDVFNTVVIQIAASDEVTALTTGTAKVTFRMPYAMTLTGIRASLTTAQASGASLLTVDVNQNGTSILSTKLTFDNTEKTTVLAGTQPVISTSALTDDGEITVDIDTIGASGATGLKITLIGTRA